MRSLLFLALFVAVPAFATPPSSHEQTITASASAGAQADSGGNTISNATEYPRQAPSVSQGSIVVGGCGAGANGGGSNTNGAAFLGFAWTPKDCRLLLAAGAYQALGMYDAACEMVNGLKAVRKQWEALGKTPPPCAVKPPETPTEPSTVVNVTQAAPVDTSAYATRDELQETAKRISEKAAGK